MIPEITRTCRRCEREKPIDVFVSDRRRPFGKGSWCRDCAAAAKRASHSGVTPTIRPKPIVFQLSPLEAARKFDKSKPGRDAADKIARCWDRLARMDREGRTHSEEGPFGCFTDCYDREFILTIIRAVEAERADAIRAMTLGVNKDAYQEALKKAERDDAV